MRERTQQMDVTIEITERKIEMATYQITFSVIGSGSLEIEAETVKEAINMFRKIELTDIVDDVDFG